MEVPDGDDVKQAARRVHDSHPYRFLVRVGLVAFGLVHLLVAYLAFQLAFGQRAEEASQSGALRELAKNPLGPFLLWATALGLLVIAIWQALTVFLGHNSFDGPKLWLKRASSAGRSVLYAVLGVNAAQVALGGTGGTEESSKSLSGDLLALPFGQLLVGVIGIAVVGVGIGIGAKGVRGTFDDDLDRNLTGAVRWLAAVGHVAKGLAIVIVGGLFVWAAATYDAEAAGGLDGALQALRAAPFGPALLGVLAVGLACFGVYCFLWSRRAKFR